MAIFPSLPLYTDAIVADCVHLTDAEFGLYMRILIQTWRNPGCRLPTDPSWLARKFQRDYESAILPLLSEFFSSTGNWWSQKRLSERHNYITDKSKKQTVRANTRWNKENESYHGNAEETVSGNASKTKTKTKEEKNIKKDDKLSKRVQGEAPRQLSLDPEDRERDIQFEKFWSLYPKQRAGSKTKGRSAYWNARQRATEQEIGTGLEKYAKSSEVSSGYAKGAVAWLNDDRWTSNYQSSSHEVAWKDLPQNRMPSPAGG